LTAVKVLAGGRQNHLLCELFQRALAYVKPIHRSPELARRLWRVLVLGPQVLAYSVQSIWLLWSSLVIKRFVMSEIKAVSNVQLHYRLGMNMRPACR
jgi:hypothetical protein